MNPFIGVLLHSIGGIFHGSFYYPLTRVKKLEMGVVLVITGIICMDIQSCFSGCTLSAKFNILNIG